MSTTIKRRAFRGLIAAVLVASGCTFAKLDEFESKAPASKIEQEGGIQSTTFGDQVLGFPQQSGNSGGILMITGNADVALHLATYNEAGDHVLSQSSPEEIKRDLDDADKAVSLALAPNQPVESYQGPFVYMGTKTGVTSEVQLVDVKRYASPIAYHPPSASIKEFGAAVTGANLNGASSLDLAVGAEGAVVLRRSQTWPNLGQDGDGVVVQGTGNWPKTAVMTKLVAGPLDLSTDEDELVLAAPSNNYVAIIHHIKSVCFKLTPGEKCTSVVDIPLPNDASLFGSSLLLADVKGDSRREVIVGAPSALSGQGAIYVYEVRDEHFKGAEFPAPDTVTVEGARGFGSSLAYGKFDGGATPTLAVGAADTEVDGHSNAGAVYLFQQLKKISEVKLLSATNDATLGRQLTVLPFTVGATTTDLLVASASGSVYVFFSNIAGLGKPADPRQHD
jgi:hypothetical protein